MGKLVRFIIQRIRNKTEVNLIAGHAGERERERRPERSLYCEGKKHMHHGSWTGLVPPAASSESSRDSLLTAPPRMYRRSRRDKAPTRTGSVTPPSTMVSLTESQSAMHDLNGSHNVHGPPPDSSLAASTRSASSAREHRCRQNLALFSQLVLDESDIRPAHERRDKRGIHDADSTTTVVSGGRQSGGV